MKALILVLLLSSTATAQGRWLDRGCCNSRNCPMRFVWQPAPQRIQWTAPTRVVRSQPVVRQQVNPEHAATPRSELATIGRLLDPKPGQRFVELGCGDARVAIYLAETFGCRVYGLETDDGQIAKARAAVRAAGVGDLVIIREADVRYANIKNADGVYVYLYPELLEQLAPKLRPVKRVVSYQHRIADLPQRKQGDFWIAEKLQFARLNVGLLA